jgi:hypothetical protein
MRPNQSLKGPMALAAVLLLLWAPACRADLLLFTLGFPLETSINGTLTYNATTGNFHSESLPVTIASPDYPGGVATFVNGAVPNQVIIDLSVNKSGQLIGTGTLQIFGTLAFNPAGTVDVSGLLLSGTITAFGAEAPGPPTRDFNGLFTITGGALTQDVPLSGGGTVFGGFPLGSVGGFTLSAENVTSGTLGDFTADFSSDDIKDQVGLVVPGPSARVLAVIGSAGLAGAGVRRRRRRRAT